MDTDKEYGIALPVRVEKIPGWNDGVAQLWVYDANGPLLFVPGAGDPDVEARLRALVTAANG